jgi:hypothetical protein
MKEKSAGDFSTPAFHLDHTEGDIKVFGKERSNVAWNTPDVAVKGNCIQMDTTTSGQAMGDFYVKCDNSDLRLNIGGSTSYVDLVTNTPKIPTGTRPLFCCPTGTIHMTGEFETKSVIGCCGLGQTLKSDGGCAPVCTEELNQSFVRAEDGTCVYKCDTGYRHNPDTPSS